MAAPPNKFGFDIEIARAAGRRWRRQEPIRSENERRLKEDGIAAVESKARMVKHANRLLDKVRRTAPAAESLSPELLPLVARGSVTAEEVDSPFMERVINETRDFLSIEFLDRALYANRSVGRVVTRYADGRVGYGTGFLVSPRLLLTNWHVLKTADSAARSSVELDYQLDRRGQPMTPQRFALDPSTFFLNDKTHDFALVAVAGTSAAGRALAEYGYCPLIADEGKILISRPVNIIQHPSGEMKQIALRENKLVDLPATDDLFAHYLCDTEPGSSGSPVFNDDWEVIALHHSAVPQVDDQDRVLDKDGNVWDEATDDPERIHWVANEGIRVSRLVAFIRSAQLGAAQSGLRDELLNPAAVPAAEPPLHQPELHENAGEIMPENVKPAPAPQPAGGSVSLTVPLTITVSLGALPQVPAPAAPAPPPPAPGGGAALKEEAAAKPDPNYDERPGYIADFCGFPAPLPELTDATRPDAVKVEDGNSENEYELTYHHFSVIMNRSRRLAFVSAVNYNPDAPFKEDRGKDAWYFDPRISQTLQAGNKYYQSNPLDRGHLTRRADGAWGFSEKEAVNANLDTFHWSNCSPQHEVFNQSDLATKNNLLLWGNIENHIAAQAKKDNRKISIYNGPVFHPSDREHRGLKIPREFWKVVVFENDQEKPRALVFILSQANLIKSLAKEEFEIGPFKVYQRTLAQLEAKTKLDFRALKDYEPAVAGEEKLESPGEPAPLESLDAIRM